jgi:hypothetical protein
MRAEPVLQNMPIDDTTLVVYRPFGFLVYGVDHLDRLQPLRFSITGRSFTARG